LVLGGCAMLITLALAALTGSSHRDGRAIS